MVLSPGGIMKNSIYKRSKIYILKKLQKLFYGRQSATYEKGKETLTFQLKAIKLGEEIKYFRILQQ